VTTEIINIVIRSVGARVVKRELESIGESATGAARGVTGLQTAIVTVGLAAVVAVTGLVRMLDTLTGFENRLRLVTSTSREFNDVQAELFAISARTRSDFETTAQIYTRTALSVRELGISQRQTLAFTESLNQAVVLSGASAREANAALIQLSQGIASDRLGGDELRSVLEQLPFVADIIAKELGLTRGKLRELGRTGAITGKTILDAFRNARREINDKFLETIPTISQAFNVLRTNLLEVLDALDDTTGASGAVANAIIGIANSLQIALPVLAAFGISLAVRFASRYIAGITAAIASEIRFQMAVQSGSVILRNSAREEQLRSAALLASATAQNTSSVAKVRDIQLTVAGLQSNLETIKLQRAQAANYVQLQQGIALATGRTSGLIAARISLNNSSRALIVTERALRAVTGELTAAQLLLTGSTSALSAAQARAAAATALTATFGATLIRLIPGLGLVVTAFTRLITLLGGPLSAAFIALFVIFALYKSQSKIIEEANRAVEDTVFSLKSAYEEVGGVLEDVTEDLLGFTEIELLTQITEQADLAAKSMRSLDKDIFAVSLLLKKEIGESPITAFLDEASVKLKDGTLNLEEFRDGLSDISVGIDPSALTAFLDEASVKLKDGTLNLEEFRDGLSDISVGIDPRALTAFLDEVFENLKDGTLNLEEFRDGLSDISVGNDPGALSLITNLIKLSRDTGSTVESLNRLQDVLTVITGTEAEASAALERLGISAGGAGDAIAVAVKDIDTFEDALTAISNFIPEFERAAKVQEDIAKVTAIYKAGLAILNTQLTEGKISQVTFSDATQTLGQRLIAAIAVIDGTTEAIEKATTAYDSYINRSDLDAGLSRRQESLRREEEALADVTAELTKNNATVDLFTGTSNVYVERLKEINDQFDRLANENRFSQTSAEVEATVKVMTDAFARLGENFDSLNEQTTGLSISDVSALLDVQLLNTEQRTQSLTEMLSGLADGLQETGSAGVSSATQLRVLIAGLEDGTTTGAQLRLALLQIASSTGGVLGDLALEAIELSRSSDEAGTDTERLRAILAVLGGTAGSADRALLGLSGSANVAASSVRGLGGAAMATINALRTLAGFVPELAAAQDVADQMLDAQTAFQSGVGGLDQQLSAGTLSLDNYAAQISRLQETYALARSEIDGTAAAQRSANEAFKEYTDDSALGALDDRARAIETETRRYNELVATLQTGENATSRIADVTAQFQQRLATVNAEFDALAEGNSGGASGAAKTVEEISDAMERKLEIVDSLLEPLRTYTMEMEILNQLLQEGTLNQDQFSQSVLTARIRFLESQTTMQAGFERGFLKIIEQTADAASQMENIITTAFDGMSSAIADLVVDGTADFGSLIRNINKMIVQLVVSQGFQQLFGGETGLGGEGGGTKKGLFGAFSGFLGGIVDSIFGIGEAAIPGAAQGGSFQVGPSSGFGGLDGHDNRLVPLRLKDGEHVEITPRGEEPGGGRGSTGTTVIFNVTTPDAQSFQASQSQLAARAARMISSGRRNM